MKSFLLAAFLAAFVLNVVQAFGQDFDASSNLDTLEATLQVAPVDSTAVDSTAVDSAKLERAAVHKKLQDEIAAMSRTVMGSDELSWKKCMTIEVVRAGKKTVQVFWFDEKMKNGPWIWQPNQARSEEWMWFDPETERFASVYLHLNSGTYIPTALAEKSGLTGNQTSVAEKKSSAWKLDSDEEFQAHWKNNESGTSVELGEKDVELAEAIISWLRLQPHSGFILPHLAAKFPAMSLEQVDANGHQQYAFTIREVSTLEEPLTMDLNKITLHDPERNLNVIAKEWADKKKAQEGQ